MKDFIRAEERIKLQPQEIAYIANKMIEQEVDRLKKLDQQTSQIEKNIKILRKKTLWS